MEQQLKKKRTSEKAQFTRAEARLEDALQNLQKTPISNIERKYTELRTRWDTVQEAHDDYMAEIEENVGDGASENEEVATGQTWINELMHRFGAIELRMYQALERTLQQRQQPNRPPLENVEQNVMMQKREYLPAQTNEGEGGESSTAITDTWRQSDPATVTDLSNETAHNATGDHETEDKYGQLMQATITAATAAVTASMQHSSHDVTDIDQQVLHDRIAAAVTAATTAAMQCQRTMGIDIYNTNVTDYMGSKTTEQPLKGIVKLKGITLDKFNGDIR